MIELTVQQLHRLMEGIDLATMRGHEIVRYSAMPSICPHDGSKLMEIGIVAREKLDIIPPQMRVIRHERKSYALCPFMPRCVRLRARRTSRAAGVSRPAVGAW